MKRPPAPRPSFLFEEYDPADLRAREEADDLYSLPYDVVIQERDGEDETTCPATLDEIQDYLKTEFDLPRKANLRFVRTADMNGVVYWLWRFRSYGDPLYATVLRDPDGKVVICADDAFKLTPEQYLVYEYYLTNGYPRPPRTWEEYKKERDAKKEAEKTADVPPKIEVDVSTLKTAFSTSELENDESRAPGDDWEFRVGDLTRRFKWAPPGEFMMGRPPEEPYPGKEDWKEAGIFLDEDYHPVILTNGFWIDEVPVTQDFYYSITGENPSIFQEARYPVHAVSWDDCQIFLEKINRIAPPGWKFSLPTEAQWEYACRAGTTTPFNVGNELTENDATFARGDNPTPANVGIGKPNLWGIYDMHGGVREWCSDWYRKKYLSKKINPTGPEKGKEKVLRGGGWHTPTKYCGSSERFPWTPRLTVGDAGFRLIMERR